MFINALAGAIDAAHPKQFDFLSRQLWQAHAEGHIPDEDAQSLSERLHRRRGDSGVAHSALFPTASSQTPANSRNAPAGLTGAPESKSGFALPGQEILPGATPIEMAAQFAAVDRARIHRRSKEMAAPECRIDRNLATRIIVKAGVMERESYKHRARYQHRGVLGDLSIALLVLLMNFSRKYGQIFPDYGTLAALMRKDKETVVEAMKRLIQHGFVTKHRRSKLIGTPQGDRRVQDSNAYEVHMPGSGLAIVPLVTAKASGSDNPDVSSSRDAIQENEQIAQPKDERFWLAEPWRMADGSIY